MFQKATKRIDARRQGVHEWSDAALTTTIVAVLFYGGLAITGLGLVVVLTSFVVART